MYQPFHDSDTDLSYVESCSQLLPSSLLLLLLISLAPLSSPLPCLPSPHNPQHTVVETALKNSTVVVGIPAAPETVPPSWGGTTMNVNAPQVEGDTTVNFTMTPAWTLPVKTAARVYETSPPTETEATTALGPSVSAVRGTKVIAARSMSAETTPSVSRTRARTPGSAPSSARKSTSVVAHQASRGPTANSPTSASALRAASLATVTASAESFSVSVKTAGAGSRVMRTSMNVRTRWSAVTTVEPA